MNSTLRSVLFFMLNKKYIGARHFPEKKIIISRTKWLSKEELKQFIDEYKQISHCFIRLKKRTGKSTDWHISINPSYVYEIEKRLRSDPNERT